MAALWMLAGLFVATLSAAGALILGVSIVSAILVYIAAGTATLGLGLAAAWLDSFSVERDMTDTVGIIPGE